MPSKLKQEKDSRVASPIADRGFAAETAEAVTSTPTPKSLKAGQYIRWTITVLPETLEQVKEMADAMSAEVSAAEGQPVSVPVLALARWIIDKGIDAYERGERPAFETRLRLK